MKKMVSTLFFL